MLTLDYRDEAGRSTVREVRPLGLWFWGKVWTLVAWCELRDDFRAFRIDRIASVVHGRPHLQAGTRQAARRFLSPRRDERDYRRTGLGRIPAPRRVRFPPLEHPGIVPAGRFAIMIAALSGRCAFGM